MKLYAIADSTQKILRLLNANVSIIQYRNKEPKHDIAGLASLSKLARQKGAKLIINDDILLAKEVGAQGVHLGKDDESVIKARQILGANAIIGASSYANIQRALELEKIGVSYIAFGAVFKSPTKINAPTCEISVIKEAKKLLKTPLCAIGGINAQNVSKLSGLGLDYIAVISALYIDDEIEKNVTKLTKAIENLN